MNREKALLQGICGLIAAAFVGTALDPLTAEGAEEGRAERDRVLFNGKIFTADAIRPYADAIAIRGDTILACGTQKDAVTSASSSAEMLDLHGRTLLPGFIDSHTHPLANGVTLTGADVGETVQTVQELAAFAARATESGRGMRGDILEITGVPLRFWSLNEELNATFNSDRFKDTPVILRGMDYHTAWSNLALRRRAGITREFLGSLSEANRIFYGHNAELEPNGFGVDAGLDKVNAFVPPPTYGELLAGGRAVIRYFNSLGITAWLEPVEDQNIFRAYRAISESGELTARVAALPKVEPRNEPASELAAVQKLRKELWGVTNLTLPGIKVFADGVAEFPSQSAAMLQPYRNSGRSGDLLFQPARFAQLCIDADRAGLLVHVHAIGDRAVRESLNGFDAARRANGPSALLHSITHLQWIDPADFPRFSELGVVASFQLYWASANADATDLVQPYVDPGIYSWQYPARSLLHAGTIIAGASDWSVSTPNVFAAMYQAETRRGPKGVLNTEQAMPREAMLRAYTLNAARLMNLADEIGSLARGKKADLILLDRDVLAASSDELKETKVIWTMLGGTIVYRRPE